MHNDLLTIGKFTIHGYGLMIGIGFAAAYLVTESTSCFSVRSSSGFWGPSSVTI